MKKIVTAVAVLLGMWKCGEINAQQRWTAPEAGSIGVEIQVNPFDQNGSTFSIDGLRMRYFLNPKHALRLNLDMSGQSETYSEEVDQDSFGSTLQSLKARTRYWEVSLGYERHFNTGSRFDFYVGGEVGFTHRFAKTTGELVNGGELSEFTITNAYTTKDMVGSGSFNLQGIAGGVRASSGFKAAALAGVDMYLYKGLYIGAELNFSLRHSNIKPVELDYRNTSSGMTITDKTNDEFKQNSYGIHVAPHLRLGWTF